MYQFIKKTLATKNSCNLLGRKTFKLLMSFSLVISSFIFVGCPPDNNHITLNVSEKTLYHEDVYQIDAKSKSAITYSSENEYYAKVSETGLVTAMFVGETNILLSNKYDSKTFKVIVSPRSNLYPEPDVKFGDSKNSILAKFGAPDLEIGPPDIENGSGILYGNYSNSAPVLMFLFDESNKMTSYAIMVKSSYSSELADFLQKRYLFVSQNNGISTFVNGLTTTTATMAIGSTQYDASYWEVMYVSVAAQNTQLRSDKSTIIKDEFDKLLKQFKRLQ